MRENAHSQGGLQASVQDVCTGKGGRGVEHA